MSEKYQQIKEIFSEVIQVKPLNDINLNSFYSANDYIETVYEYVRDNHYREMTKNAMLFLEIGYTKLDALLLEIVCNNLYCDLALILQILQNKGLPYHLFLSRAGVYSSENKKAYDRFTRRLSPARLLNTKKIYLPDDEESYNIQILANVFLETLLIKKDGKYKISEVFTDIFKGLIYNTDDESDDKLRQKNIDLIKSYRIWDFNEDTLSQLLTLYNEVLTGKSKYKHAEINLLEKLFGLMTISVVQQKGFTKKELELFLDGLSRMCSLGYGSITNLLINKTTKKNIHAMVDFITEYIYPLCSECIKTILNGIIIFLGRLKAEKRAEFIEKFLNGCEKNILYSFSKSAFTNSAISNTTLEIFRMSHHIPKQSDKDAIKQYIIELFADYSDERFTVDENSSTITLTVNYNDFAYLKKSFKTDYYEDLSSDDFTFYRNSKIQYTYPD